MSKLNLWCGFDIREWYVNVDIVDGEWVDKVFDFEQFPYPFNDNTFDEVYCSMVMEHIYNLSQMINELVRICKDWAKIKIIVPYFSSPNLWWDLTHLRWFNTTTFVWFHSNSLKSFSKIRLVKQKIHFLSNPKFMKSVRWNIIPDFFVNLSQKIYERCFCYIFASSEIHFLLKIKKD